MNALAWELAGLIAIALLAAAGLIPANGPGVRQARRWFTRLANRRSVSILLAGALGFGASAAASAVRAPAPAIHDEFSYLLAADTFAHGRLTNPTHPHWQHFESFHIIHEPSYASKYPPAQGLVLALGQVLGGRPIVGVWIGMGLASAALCWMMQGWMRARWALFAALLFALHPSIEFVSHFAWGYSYWGGAVPMAGGALVFGALPRLLRGGRFVDGTILAGGAVVLANSRPYEGLVACLPVAAVLLWQLLGGRISIRRFGWTIVLPALLVACVAATAMAYYNQRVTGCATMLPYQLHEATYGAYPLFLWRDLTEEPSYRHPVMRRFHVEWGLSYYLMQRDVPGWLRVKGIQFAALWSFFCGFLLTIPLLSGICALHRWDMRFACGALALSAAASALVPWTQPHYVAPTAPLVWLLLVQGWRRLGGTPQRSSFRRRFARGLLAAFLLLFAARLALHWTSEPTGWQWQRLAIAKQLAETPGEHLVFVHYSDRHNTLEEWVYNRADLDAAKVVWARIMGPQENRALIDYYGGRQIWIVDADAQPGSLRAWRQSL